MASRDAGWYLRNFVYSEEGAAEYMVERDIACFAVDALSADRPGASLAEHHVHSTLLPEDVLIVERVANLGRAGPGRYDVICTPTPYADRDGSRVRLPVRPQD